MNKRVKQKKILITGGGGFIGSNFLKFSSNNRFKNTILAPSREEMDIMDIKSVRRIFHTFNPDIVINFAAHRDANSAEKQRKDKSGSVWRSNVVGVRNLSRMSTVCKSFFIQISTDMVFSGSKKRPGPYRESDKPESTLNNLSWYGWTKAEAERILAKNNNAAIIRIGNVTQPVYDPKLDYVGKILYLFDQKKLYPLFDDQYVTLTYIPSIFEVIEKVISTKRKGIFHVSSTNSVTPFELAKYLIGRMRGNKKGIRKISIDDYLRDTPNRYPKFGGLLSEKTRKRLKLRSFSWEQIIEEFMKTMNNQFRRSQQ